MEVMIQLPSTESQSIKTPLSASPKAKIDTRNSGLANHICLLRTQCLKYRNAEKALRYSQTAWVKQKGVLAVTVCLWWRSHRTILGSECLCVALSGLSLFLPVLRPLHESRSLWTHDFTFYYNIAAKCINLGIKWPDFELTSLLISHQDLDILFYFFL